MDPDYSEFRLFWEMNKDKFPKDWQVTLGNLAEIATFHFEVYKPCAERMSQALRRLMMRQYPLLKTAMHPAQLRYIDDIVKTVPFTLVFGMKRLLKEQKESRTHPFNPTGEGNATRQAEYIRGKYPKIDDWREFYGKPEEPMTVSDDSRNMHLWPRDEDWEKYKTEQNRELSALHERRQQRLTAFYDIVQPLLFEYLPELESFDGDFWVLYAVTLRDEYEGWKDSCEHLESSIEYHLPPESVDWEWNRYKEALRAARQKRRVR